MNLVIIQNRQVVTTSLKVAETFGKQHKNVIQSIENLAAENSATKNMFFESTYENRGKQYKVYYMNRDGFTLLAMGFTGKKAMEFKLKYIEAFNAMEAQLQQPSNMDNRIAFETHLIGVEYTTKILRVDETSKIKMLEEAHKRYGVPTNHLPQYVDEEVTVSLTTLLRKHGITISTAKINTKLIELGILEIKERPSSKGGVKEFKSLTEKGLYYGKNLINPRCPKETQPHYYESKFSELIRMLIGEAA